jgi:threonylcarbamoyladenosine tRNA methylthiotransferase MtaB
MAKHLHIPLQSGSEKILKLMNRKYDLAYFLERVKLIKKQIPDISLTTDLIVGFPDETDKDFLDTLNTIEEIKFTKIHTFPYSKRDGTLAASMPNQIPSNIKKERVRKVLDLSSKYEHIFYKDRINKSYDILTETRKNNITIGHTSNYIPITITKDIPNNEVIKVKITDVTSDNQVLGEIIEK